MGEQDADFVNLSRETSVPRPDGRHLFVNTARRGLSPFIYVGDDLGSGLAQVIGELLVKEGRGYVVAIYRGVRFMGPPRTLAFAYASTAEEAREIGARWVTACNSGEFNEVNRKVGWRERRQILASI